MFKNFLFLSILQGVGLLAPLILTPYLVKVLGFNGFGKISVALAIAGYVQIIADYGFHLSAVKQISQNLALKKDNSAIFSAVVVIKLIIYIFFLLFILLAIFLYLGLGFWFWLILSTSIGSLGNVLFPVWWFQGFEKMALITIVQSASKILTILLTILLITDSHQLLHFAWLQSVMLILAGVIGLIFAKRIGSYRFAFPELREMKKQLTLAWPIFLSSFSVNIYMNSSTLILKLFVSDTIVGIYATAEKILNGMRNGGGVILQVIYPRVCQLISLKRITDLKIFNLKIYFLIFSLFFLAGNIVFYFSYNISEFFASNKYGNEIGTLQILLKMLAFVPLVITLNIPAYSNLLALDAKKQYMLILISGAVLSIVSNFLLVPIYFEIGTAIAVIVTEIFITFSLIIAKQLYSNKIKDLQAYE